MKAGILRETTGYHRNRRFRYDPYLSLFESPDFAPFAPPAGTEQDLQKDRDGSRRWAMTKDFQIRTRNLGTAGASPSLCDRSASSGERRYHCGSMVTICPRDSFAVQLATDYRIWTTDNEQQCQESSSSARVIPI